MGPTPVAVFQKKFEFTSDVGINQTSQICEKEATIREECMKCIDFICEQISSAQLVGHPGSQNFNNDIVAPASNKNGRLQQLFKTSEKNQKSSSLILGNPSIEHLFPENMNLKISRNMNWLNYNTISRGIMDQNYNSQLLVWCPLNILATDFIVSVLSKFDRKVRVRTISSVIPFISDRKIICGVFVKFRDQEKAMAADRELRMLSRSVMTMPLSNLLHFIILSESQHPQCGTMMFTRAIVKSKKKNQPKERDNTKQIFRKYGDVKRIRFNNGEDLDPNVVCEVCYAYAAQAYAAKISLDPFSLVIGDNYSVEIQETQYEKEIMKKLRRIMIIYAEESRIFHN